MRRIALALVLWLGCTVLAYGQQAHVPVVGRLNPYTKQTVPIQLLRDSLAKHGLVDGESVRLDIRLAEDKLDRLPALAKELVREGFARGQHMMRREFIAAICSAAVARPIVALGQQTGRALRHAGIRSQRSGV